MPAVRSLVLTLAGALILGAGCSRGDRASTHADQPGTATSSGAATTGQGIDATLDRLVADGWARAGVSPSPMADDATYLRRVTLDLTGRIPTPEAVTRFLADSSPGKRRALVDQLLGTEAYAEHWAGVYTDLLMAGRTKQRPQVSSDTRAWLAGAFEAGTGYDQITTEILTAQGEFDGPGPYGFLVTHAEKNNVESVTGKTARIFLGITLECAQCHDHPSDPRYSQQDFYSMAAYFARSKARLKKDGGKRVPTIVEKRRGEMRMPTHEDGPGERSGDLVQPGFLSRPMPSNPEGRRAALAQQVVASDLFAKTVVARTWSRLLGHGVVDRWDDLGGENDDTHPPILDHLATQFIAQGYDMRALLRMIVLSDAYQRASWSPERATDQVPTAERAFAQAPVRSMDANQLFRSLMIATSVEDSRSKLFRKNVERGKDRALKEYRFVFADDEMGTADAFSGSVPQALLLLNGELVQTGVSDIRGTTVHDVLDRHEEPAARVDALYLRVYGRRPTAAQRDRALALLDEREHGSSAYEDLMHAMLLSSEFLTIH
ncbi:MAG: DUF1549 and DUF1553 domain-containing protein [Myxococcota bacterium]